MSLCRRMLHAVWDFDDLLLVVRPPDRLLKPKLRTGGHVPPIGGSMETTTTAGDLNYLREKKVRSSWSYEGSRNITRLSASES